MTTAEKHFETLKDTCLPLPIWYQDGLTKQWKSGKYYRERDMLIFFQMDPTKSVSSFFKRSAPRELPAFKIERKRQNPRKEEVPKQAIVAVEISKKHCAQHHLPRDLPPWRQIKTLTNQAENLVSQQEMPQNPENIFVSVLALLAFALPAQAEYINHTYWAYIPNPFYCRL